MVREAQKFGLPAKQCASQADVEPGITVTNYAKLHHFDLSKFVGVILDESSILKAFDGKTRNALIEQCAQVPYRLAATATPAPNDFTELGNHAEFLGVMTLHGMQATFFTHDARRHRHLSPQGPRRAGLLAVDVLVVGAAARALGPGLRRRRLRAAAAAAGRTHHPGGGRARHHARPAPEGTARQHRGARCARPSSSRPAIGPSCGGAT
jgi:hypothetical protein